MASQADVERTRTALQYALESVISPDKVAKYDEPKYPCDFYLTVSDAFLGYFNEALAAGDEKLALQYLAISNSYFHEYINCS